MTTLYVKNFSPDKERKVRIFQLTKTGGFYSESPQVVPMDPLGASIGISLSKYIECEGSVNRGGMIISRNKTNINKIIEELESFGIKVNVLEEWGLESISCEGGLTSAEGLTGANWGTFELIIDGVSQGKSFSFGYSDFDSDRELLRTALKNKGIDIIFEQEAS